MLSSPNNLTPFEQEFRAKRDEKRDTAQKGHGQFYGKCGHRIEGCRCDCGIKMTLDMDCEECQSKNDKHGCGTCPCGATQYWAPFVGSGDILHPHCMACGKTDTTRIGQVEHNQFSRPPITPEVKTIELTIDPISDPILPSGDEWGLPAGPLPVTVQQHPNPAEDWVCPHCQNVIGEKESYSDFDSGKSFHRPCRGEFIRPEMDAAAKALHDHFIKILGIREGLIKEDLRTDKPSVLICDALITETMAKGVEERVFRRTRRSVGVTDHKVGPKTIRKSADNDPTKTSRGRTNFRGTKKRSQDAKKRRNPQQFVEAADFIRDNYQKSADVILQNGSRLNDPLRVLDILNEISGKVNKEWVNTAKSTLTTMLEGRDFRCNSAVGLISHRESMEAAKACLTEDVKRVRKYFPEAWAAKDVDFRNTIVRYRIYGLRGPRYDIAQSEGLVEAV